MKKAFNLKKELSFEENASSITSISLDTTFNEEKESVEGIFLIEGNYKTHELSINKKDFKFELPFCEKIENLKEDTAAIEVEDFTYDLEDNILTINIDYEVDYEENEIDEVFDEEEFERFLSEHEVDVVNFSEEEIIEEKAEEGNADVVEIVPEEPELDIVDDVKEEAEQEREVNIVPADDSEYEENNTTSEVILNNIDKEEKYITYHVYICESDDTFESISEKFKTTKEEIREYNEIDDIEYGRKIIIPVKDEQN